MFFSSHFPSGIGFSRGTVAAKIAKAESRGKRKRSFHFGSAEPHPVLGEAKDLQVERSGKRKRSFHLGSAEPHPVLGEAKDLQVERRGKSKTRFSLLTMPSDSSKGAFKAGRAGKQKGGRHCAFRPFACPLFRKSGYSASEGSFSRERSSDPEASHR